VTESTPWHLIAGPRPGGPGDRYLLELTQRSPNRDVLVRDESSPVEPVDAAGTLEPGDYRVRYVATLMTTTAESSTQYMFTLYLGVDACGPSDLGRAGGVQGADGTLDNNDFIAFIDLFFATEARADRGQAGGLSGGDGDFDNNDFIVFITQFFSGCAA
ncbi:MAG: hypothetical protein K2Q09_10025, partial [Phycisphaerales bacterium]|nr:hypothetical protein [Phycisphaerales bacterium]